MISSDLKVMNYKLEIVRKLPLAELWNDRGKLDYKRGRQLSPTDIKAMVPNVRFVIAALGANLVWLDPEESSKFWKTEIKPHMKNSVDYGYWASEWTSVKDIIIVFEQAPSRY